LNPPVRSIHLTTQKRHFDQKTPRKRMRSIGDHEFETRLFPHLNPLFQTALHLTDRADAESVVQEVYGRALKTFDVLEPGDSRMFLFKILMRRLKSRRREAFLSRFTTTEVEAVGEESDIAACSAEQMLSALTRIPLVFREVILLVDCQAF